MNEMFNRVHRVSNAHGTRHCFCRPARDQHTHLTFVHHNVNGKLVPLSYLNPKPKLKSPRARCHSPPPVPQTTKTPDPPKDDEGKYEGPRQQGSLRQFTSSTIPFTICNNILPSHFTQPWAAIQAPASNAPTLLAFCSFFLSSLRHCPPSSSKNGKKMQCTQCKRS